MNSKIVNSVWESLPDHHDVRLDGFVVMPEHIHLILWIYNSEILKDESIHPYFNGGRILQDTHAAAPAVLIHNQSKELISEVFFENIHQYPTPETKNNVGAAKKTKKHVSYGRVVMHDNRTHQQQSMNKPQSPSITKKMFDFFG
ncbi:hypothetical protein JXI42_00175 [bacterium]|nr:hypothetical protein [bacterium]